MAQIKQSEARKIGEKFNYKVFSVRLHNGTLELLKESQKKSGNSWNKFIFKLLTEKYDQTKTS